MTEIRLYRPGDEIAINDAFNRVFGNARTLEEWRWKYRPDEMPCPIVAAWDGGRLAAHNGGIAADYQVEGRRLRALQGADTLSLAAIERRSDWRDAWQRVMDYFAEVAVEQFSAALLYGFTGGRAIEHMLRRAKWDSVEARRIPLFVRRQRPVGRSVASRLFKARLIGYEEPALDTLWERVRDRYPVSVVRDAAHVRRRLSRHPTVRYHRWLISPRWSTIPAAFVAFRTDGGVCRWVELVWDGRPGALELADHLSRKLAEQTGAKHEELWLDGDEDAAGWLEIFGFESAPDPSGVVRVTRFLDDSLPAEAFAPGRVYMTSADADLV
jgi:hypothetical protein